MSKWRDGSRYKISRKNLIRNHNKKMATHTVGHQEVLPCTAVLILSTVSFLFISESNGSPYYKKASGRETLESKILEYVDYFERPTISSPLKSFSTAREYCILWRKLPSLPSTDKASKHKDLIDYGKLSG